MRQEWKILPESIEVLTNPRSRNVVRNIFASSIFRGGAALISFIVVPITLDYLNDYEYGVWLTISTTVSWIFLLDIGLGNGLRNKLTEALAIGDRETGQIYVSTTFFVLTVIIGAFFLIYLLFSHWLDWYSILNVEPQKVDGLGSVILVVFGLSCVTFIVRLIGTVYTALQRPAMNDIIYFIGSLISLIIIWMLTKTTSGSLRAVAIVFTAVPAIIYAAMFPILFSSHPYLKPSLHKIRLSLFGELASLSARFFVIQITTVVIFLSSNIIISRLLGPAEVTPYNIAYKYFSILLLASNIMLTPIWSAVTQAYTKGDTPWMQSTLRRLLLMWGLMCVAAVVMTLLSGTIYTFWIGDEVTIPFHLTFWCAAYVVLLIPGNIFVNFINGTGKLHIQFFAEIVQTIIFIPLSIYLCQRSGIIGIPVALTVISLIRLAWSSRQCMAIIRGTAAGSWNR
ncbi:MAG: oligosaccharide flippase family protein [Muribaculaceae bacterium]|nr:oligosaccharide flippase family protein [Muribaculaceae bacterium]